MAAATRRDAGLQVDILPALKDGDSQAPSDTSAFSPYTQALSVKTGSCFNVKTNVSTPQAFTLPCGVSTQCPRANTTKVDQFFATSETEYTSGFSPALEK
jgi:Zn-dependent alcohol dehydrogenase